MLFNPFQMEAVRHYTGPIQVIAGPGSGKTSVITGRVQYLIEQYSVNPGNILTMTFSRAAAEEMSRRFESLRPNLSQAPAFGTFHSIFYRILQKHLPEKIRILSEQEVLRHLQTELRDVPDISLLRDLLNEISAAKNAGISLEDYRPQNIPEEVFQRCFPVYQRFLQTEHAIDFDDIQIRTLRLFRNDAGLLRQYQEQYRFLQVDEFQDVNLIQYEILKLLAGTSLNVFVVGDDDQSIYGFRGAAPSIMRAFSEDFPSSRQVELRYNYRCPEVILIPAQQLIQKNRNRFAKSVLSKHEIPEASFQVHRYPDQKKQYQEMGTVLWKYRAAGIPWSDMCILLRGKTNAAYISRKLQESGIPSTDLADSVSIYSHFICKDICSYLKAAMGIAARKDMLCILERPFRQISRYALPRKEQNGTAEFLNALRNYDPEDPHLQMQVTMLDSQLQMLRKLSPYAALMYLYKACGYEQLINEQCKGAKEDSSDHEFIFRQLLNMAKQYRSLKQFLNALETENQPTALSGEDAAGFPKEDSRSLSPAEESSRDAVHILTLHASKGLEFPVVWIPDLNHGIFPAARASLEEERRLLYVGMTRASCHLHLSYAETMHGKQVSPSRFLEELSVSEEMLVSSR